MKELLLRGIGFFNETFFVAFKKTMWEKAKTMTPKGQAHGAQQPRSPKRPAGSPNMGCGWILSFAKLVEKWAWAMLKIQESSREEEGGTAKGMTNKPAIAGIAAIIYTIKN